jgi:hypothetical protein
MNEFDRVNSILALARKALELAPSNERISIENHLENIRFASGYIGVKENEHILIGNWNAPNNLCAQSENAFNRFVVALEKAATLEWDDSCDLCVDCGRVFETQPLHVWWHPRYELVNDEYVCHFCLAQDPSDYFESIEQKPDISHLNVKPENFGYVKLNAEPIEMTASDTIKLKQAIEYWKEMGLRRFFFSDTKGIKGACDIYVHEDEPIAFL